MAEADSWIPAQPKNAKGLVDVELVIAEGQRRGYCICPRPLRRMIDFSKWLDGKQLFCKWCGQPETRESWAFWYAE